MAAVTSYTWTLSADGSPDNAIDVDTSSDRYTVVSEDTLDVTLRNVTGADGGLYRCVYNQGDLGSTTELCVYVYGKLLTLSDSFLC